MLNGTHAYRMDSVPKHIYTYIGRRPHGILLTSRYLKKTSWLYVGGIGVGRSVPIPLERYLYNCVHIYCPWLFQKQAVVLYGYCMVSQPLSQAPKYWKLGPGKQYMNRFDLNNNTYIISISISVETGRRCFRRRSNPSARC